MTTGNTAPFATGKGADIFCGKCGVLRPRPPGGTSFPLDTHRGGRRYDTPSALRGDSLSILLYFLVFLKCQRFNDDR